MKTFLKLKAATLVAATTLSLPAVSLSAVSLSAIFLSSVSASADAAVSMVDTGLWQSAKLRDLTISFTPAKADDSDLIQGCNGWHDIANSLGDIAPQSGYSTQFDNWRKTPNYTNDFGGFYATVLNYSRDQLAQELQSQKNDANYLMSASGGTFVLPVDRYSLNLIGSAVITTDDESLTHFAKLVGLPQSRFDLTNAAVVVHGRDLACDLIQGHAQLKIIANAETDVATGDVQARLSDLKFLADAANYVLAKKSSPLARAAYMGMKISRALRNESDSETERKIDALIPRFFDLKTMNVNSLWSRNRGEWSLNPVYRSFYHVNVVVKNTIDRNTARPAEPSSNNQNSDQNVSQSSIQSALPR